MPRVLTYKGYVIEPMSGSPDSTYTFTHEDYDPTSILNEVDGPPHDRRWGTGDTIEDCRKEIDEQIEFYDLDQLGHFTRRSEI